MAFHLDVRHFLDDHKLQEEAEPILLEKLRAANFDPRAIRRRVSMNFSRLDPESLRSPPISDVDISFQFMLGITPLEAAISAWCFLKAISLARHIRTDRLHVGIGAALLGTPCELRDNSYGKNSSVYGHSLAGRFPNLRFIVDRR
jgi:exopolysaccharide biosynthesis predicted pyruvyltransferase EpsI